MVLDESGRTRVPPDPHDQVAFVYRPDIDGLRAVAIVSVFLFHLGLRAFPGGFVGVDVFFVISGYLITQTILADRAKGCFSLGHFYERRIRRIFPALFVMSAVCLVAASVLSIPQDMRRLGQGLIAMALFVSNMFERYTGAPTGYFGGDARPDPLLHTWSLSVEEQFYIVLPLGLVWLLRRRTHAVAWIAGACLLSFALCVVWTKLNQKEAFYLVVTRAWELLIGTVLALARWRPALSRLAREAIAAVGLAMIAYAVLRFSSDTPFPGAAALLPCLGTFLVILAGERGLSLVGRLLASPPFVFVGALSYSLYLWHWPTIVFVKQLTVGAMPVSATALVVVVASCAAYLSYRFVERPFRRKGITLSQRGWLTAGLGASFAAVTLGIGLVATDGLASRFAPQTRMAIAANLASAADHFDPSCANWKLDVHSLNEISACPLAGKKAGRILFVGDSHVGVLLPLIERLSKTDAFGGRSAAFAITGGCPPTERMTLTLRGYHCNGFSRIAMQLASQDDVEIVFIGFSAWWDTEDFVLCKSQEDRCGALLRKAEAEERFVAELRADVEGLRRRGKQVIVMLPTPNYRSDIPRYLIHQATLQRFEPALRLLGMRPSLARSDFQPLRQALTTLASQTGAVLFDPRRGVCSGETCLYARDGVSIYSDSNHIATHALDLYEAELRAAFRQLEPPAAPPIAAIGRGPRLTAAVGEK